MNKRWSVTNYMVFLENPYLSRLDTDVLVLRRDAEQRNLLHDTNHLGQHHLSGEDGFQQPERGRLPVVVLNVFFGIHEESPQLRLVHQVIMYVSHQHGHGLRPTFTVNTLWKKHHNLVHVSHWPRTCGIWTSKKLWSKLPWMQQQPIQSCPLCKVLIQRTCGECWRSGHPHLSHAPSYLEGSSWEPNKGTEVFVLLTGTKAQISLSDKAKLCSIKE